MDDSGNRWLRELSVGKARSLCKASLLNYPRIKARYKDYERDHCEAKRTYTDAYRGIDRTKGISRRRGE